MKALTDFAELRTLLALPPGPIFTDTETTGLNPRRDTLVLVQLYQTGLAEPILIDWRKAWPSWADLLSEVFAKHLLVAHNAKFDLGVLRANGVSFGQVFCTQVAEQVLRGVGLEDARVQGIEVSLAGLAKTYGVRTTPLSKAEREWFYVTLPLDIEQEIPEAQLAYAAEDVKVLADIYEAQQAELELRDDRGATDLRPVLALEMRVLPALVDVELAGIRIDTESWRAFIADKAVEAKGHEDMVLETFGEPILSERIRQYDADMVAFEAYKAAEEAEIVRLKAEWQQPDTKQAHLEAIGHGMGWGDYKQLAMRMWRALNPRPDRPKLDTTPPNVGSSTQLLSAFRVLGIPFETTDSKQLAPYEHDYPAIGTLIRYRKAQKFVDSFGESLLAFVEDDGRIHPDYNQIGASTGRMSCTRPNWQQVPSRGDGKKLRECVVAAPGYKLLTADFSNIEMRILAEYSRDERLLGFFDADVDLHSEVARLMFGLDESVDPKTTPCPAVPGWSYRDVAKTINYGLVYGMSATRLARTALITQDEAQRLMDAYFALFPGVVNWLKRAREVGVKLQRSRTLLGRVRPYHLPHPVGIGAPWEVRNEYRRAIARIERQSMNTPIQGTSADITKEALARYFELPGTKKGRVVAIVHDELVVEVRDEYAERSGRLLATAMDEAQSRVCRLKRNEEPRVRLTCPEVHISDRWEK